MSKLKLTGKSNILKKTTSGINPKELSLALSDATKCGPGINPKRGFISLPNFNSLDGNKDELYGLYILDGELVVDTIVDVKNETNPNCGNGGGGAQALRLTFDSIENANLLVGDASNVSDWNTFFDLPTYGNPFTSVEVVGNEVRLFGGSNIIMRENLFDLQGPYLLEVDDQAGCVIELEYSVFGDGNNNGSYNLTYVNFPNVIIAGAYAFGGAGSSAASLVINLPNLTTAIFDSFQGCTSLTTISLPQLTTAGNGCFFNCPSLTTISLPQLTSAGLNCFNSCMSLTTINLSSCINLGGTVGGDNVFLGIVGNNITLTVPAALMTAQSGSPDGDIAYLQANNTVTVVTV